LPIVISAAAPEDDKERSDVCGMPDKLVLLELVKARA
jgi:hypothetical protein